MQTGTVKWFDDGKGYGFIQGDDGVDYFVHFKSIIMSGRKTLNEGQKVSFDTEDAPKGKQAVNVTVEG